MEIRRHKHGFVVGIFTVLALAVFIVTIFTLGGEQKSFSKKFPVKVVFSEINGLKQGNNVWFSGVKIGTVKSIVLKGASNVEVTLSIEKKSQPFIRQDAMAKIGSEGFLGNKIVIIYAGTSTTPEIEANEYLHVQKDSITNEDMIATLQSSNKNLLDITNNIKAISEKIKAGEGTVGRLLNDPSLVNSLQATLNDFKTVAARGEQAISNLEEFTERINSQNSSINKLFADTLLFDSVKSSISQLRSIAQTANDFANNLDTFAANLKTASENLRDTNNTAGILLNDKQIAEDIHAIIKNLKSASVKLNDDLEAAQHNFLLRGYFKKTGKNIPPPDSTK